MEKTDKPFLIFDKYLEERVVNLNEAKMRKHIIISHPPYRKTESKNKSPRATCSLRVVKSEQIMIPLSQLNITISIT